MNNRIVIGFNNEADASLTKDNQDELRAFIGK